MHPLLSYEAENCTEATGKILLHSEQLFTPIIAADGACGEGGGRDPILGLTTGRSEA